MLEEITKELQDDEDILYSGSPVRKLYTPNELIRIPLSFLLIAGFLVYYIFFATIDPKVLALTIAIGVVYVIYNVVVKTILKTLARKQTVYIITGKRLLFVRMDGKGTIKKTVSLKISDIASCSVFMNKDNTGSVIFSASKDPETYPLKIGNNWINYPGGVVPIFFDITDYEEAKTVYNEIRQQYITETEDTDGKPFSKYDD